MPDKFAHVLGYVIVFVSLLIFGMYRFYGSANARYTATQAVRNAGLQEVLLTGPVWLRCSDAAYAVSFTALRNTDKQYVEGIVCCGWFKACTVKW